MDFGYDLTEQTTREILRRKVDGFILGSTPQTPHINFYFLPKRLQNSRHAPNSPAFNDELEKVMRKPAKFKFLLRENQFTFLLQHRHFLPSKKILVSFSPFQVTQAIVHRMTLDKKMVLATKKPSKELPSFLVLALAHSALTIQDVKYMLDLVQFYGQDL